jgi:hypothetical protein
LQVILYLLKYDCYLLKKIDELSSLEKELNNDEMSNNHIYFIEILTFLRRNFLNKN